MREGVGTARVSHAACQETYPGYPGGFLSLRGGGAMAEGGGRHPGLGTAAMRARTREEPPYLRATAAMRARTREEPPYLRRCAHGLGRRKGRMERAERAARRWRSQRSRARRCPSGRASTALANGAAAGVGAEPGGVAAQGETNPTAQSRVQIVAPAATGPCPGCAALPTRWWTRWASGCGNLGRHRRPRRRGSAWSRPPAGSARPRAPRRRPRQPPRSE
jgi:hypothetical protein